jgi:hypothetical protein
MMPDNLPALAQSLTHNPFLLAYLAGLASGFTLARRLTRYMLGGRP